MLFDQFGREIEKIPAKPDGNVIAAVSLKDRYSSYPSSGLTPQKLASILKEADTGVVSRQAELFEEMEEKDAHLASLFQTRKLAVQGLEHQIIPGDESSKAADIAEFCSDVIGRLDWDHIMLDFLDAIPKGYSGSENIWDISEGQAAVADIRWIHPKRFTWKDSQVPRVIPNPEDASVSVEMPWYQFIFHQYRARSGNPVRNGVLRTCAWMYIFKNYAIKDWAAFAEVYGIPLRLGKYDPSASKEDKDALRVAIQAIGSDAAGIISKATEIEFIEAMQKTASVDVFKLLIAFTNGEMSQAVLGQTLTSDVGPEGVGSRALGEVHADVRQDIKKADCRAIDRTITNQLLWPLTIFNYGPDAPKPRYKSVYEPPADMVSEATKYKTIKELGFPMSQEHISKKFNIPMIGEGETPLERVAPSSPFAAGMSAKTANLAARYGLDPLKDWRKIRDLEDRQFESDALRITSAALAANDRRVPEEIASGLEGRGKTKTEAALDTLSGMAIEQAPEVMADITAQISRILDECNSLEEFRDKVMTLADSIDFGKFEDLVKKAMTLANLTGRFNARR